MTIHHLSYSAERDLMGTAYLQNSSKLLTARVSVEFSNGNHINSIIISAELKVRHFLIKQLKLRISTLTTFYGVYEKASTDYMQLTNYP